MQPNAQLGEYQFLEKLGEGGMGAVYKALHTKLKRTVAIKILSKDRLWDEQAVARFEREMEVVGALDHPHIVRAHDAREIEGTRFLVMEYVDGLDVSTLVRACQPLPIADACEIVRQAALALQHAHEHGLVHRDVKPSNLMVTAQGVVKLLDLGLARFEHDQAARDEVTGTGQAMGTVNYMAPEQVSDARSVDIRADIYSLGCTLYKLLAGRTPFEGPKYKTAAARLMAHLSEPVPPVRQFRADVPEPLVRVLDRMLAKEPGNRFSTPAEVADAVGPLAARSNLAALVAWARGEPIPEALPQAMTATQELASSSGFTRLMKEIIGTRGPTVREASRGRRALSPKVAMIVRMLGLGALAMAAALIWGLYWASKDDADRGKSGPARQAAEAVAADKTYLVLHWPAEERDGASCEIDGQAQDMARLDLLSLGGQIKLPCTPGEHTLLMKRLGYEEFEQRVTASEGQEIAIRPTWKELGAVAKLDVPKPPTSPLSPEGTRTGSEGEKTSSQVSPKGQDGKSMPAPPPEPKESPEAIAARKRLEALDARYAEAMKPVEKPAAAWDFRGAAVELQKIRFEEKELQERLAQRRDELKRMYNLKQKVVAKINDAKPPFKKSALGIKGMGGELVHADDAGLACKLLNGKSETLAWSDIGAKAVPKLLEQAVDPASPEDRLAAALIALACEDVPLAEKCFDQARLLGADIDRYLTPLASAAFARAKDLVDKKLFTAAETALEEIEAKYAAISWFRANQKTVTALRETAKRAALDAEAEKLYAEAAELFGRKEFYDLKPVVDRLKTDYANTRPVIDRERKPTFAELEKATSKLGKRLTVCLDGKGHFRSILAAVNAASIGDLVEIHDNGPYSESVIIPAEKSGLTLRGAKGAWPLLVSMEPNPVAGSLIEVRAPNSTIQRMILVNLAPNPRSPHCLATGAAHVKVEGIVAAEVGLAIENSSDAEDAEFENCLLLGTFDNVSNRGFRVRNCLVKHLSFTGGGSGEARACTIQSVGGAIAIYPNTFADCIIGDIDIGFARDRTLGRMDYCLTFGTMSPQVQRGKGCISANPMFRDPTNLDYRLQPGSACIGKASDGGDLGCRYTPEMIEMCKVALELRRRGILKF